MPKQPNGAPPGTEGVPPSAKAGTPSLPGAPPLELRLRGERRILRVSFADGAAFDLSAEYLRVKSPSAEVRGHGRGGGQLPLGKSGVRVTAVEPVGQYAVRLVFDDGHDSGIYSWKYLRELGEFRDEYWAAYLEEASAAQKAHASN